MSGQSESPSSSEGFPWAMTRKTTRFQSPLSKKTRVVNNALPAVSPKRASSPTVNELAAINK